MSTKKGKKYKTTANLNMRKAANTKGTVITVIKKGSIVECLKDSNSKWSKVKYSGKTGYVNNSYIELYSSKKNKGNKKSSSASESLSNAELKSVITQNKKTSQNAIANLLATNNMNGIYGAPYQFMPNVDPRLGEKTNFGWFFAEDIVANMPLLMITPGEPNFLSGFSKRDKKNFITILNKSAAGKLGDKVASKLEDLIDTKGDDRKYYTFKFDYTTYYNYVNPMLWNCAEYLGIGNKEIKIGTQTAKLTSFNWSKAYNKLKKYTNCEQFVSFYLDSENSIQESFSNETTNSQLADSINSFSSTANELKFLQGAILGRKPVMSNKDAYDEAKKSLDEVSNKYLNGSKLIKSLGQGVLTVASGGKLLFPEVWSDSRYTKSYDISIKLRTPDNDKLSWYLNICVPLMHLIALTAPRQLSANGYTSPFLVRAFYKGLFNVDMGMIDTLTITKAKEGAWTSDGLPTEVDITMSIKDLYQALFISGFKKNQFVKGKLLGQDTKFILKNTGMMDYLASTCGVNINKAEIARTLQMFMVLYKNNIKMTGSTWAAEAKEGVYDKLNSIYRGVFGW